jgi:hypothetical protein
MALSQQQQALARSIAVTIGTTLHLVPDQADVSEYVQLINNEVSAIAGASVSNNPVKDEVEAILDLAQNIENNMADGTQSKPRLKAAISFMMGVAHIFGL